MPTAREALLDAALRALGNRPWHTVRMVDVAALAGVSRQTLYNEFGTKGGLATALLRQAADRYLTGVDRALTAPAPERPAAVARWTVRAARADPLVKGLLTGVWREGLPRPGPGVPLPGHLLAVARDRMEAAAHPLTPARCERVLRLALSYVIVPGDSVVPRRQCAEPESWSPITPMITSEIDTSFRVETTSPRKTMP
ncbi:MULTISPECIES: TetR/AcrR family transcriptional regulator [unclassified Streptomyces]|uniref:TetR/AcrR family transcriptional regulator n=1 Tax=Streptomyces TaxID=1883 RepID=UPI0019D0A69D|nr:MULTISPECIES: TetR/AcrR family transcriptional regulator [unclassified Streptomyces]UQA36278.1 TetR/AcrR family transcriptional regulator [Streptomyces sp. HNA39]